MITFQSCLLQQSASKLILLIFGRTLSMRRRVVNFIPLLGDAQHVAGHEPFRFESLAVDLDAVAAAQVLDSPEAVDVFQLAVVRRNVWKLQLDIAMRSPPNQQLGLEQRNRIAASARDQFAERLEVGHN